ncbi:hypothetical protein GDO78_017712 [Eleutherodactylus coqui]|uniref:Uncharacterized protein n=1 Tax=Eleutherodactylus coqui TaxID=57060 RepID=A0A8J6E3E3_ELECQ|nr:hypothetical protein GDO78_017712 [Eleutherodactylus coqui]
MSARDRCHRIALENAILGRRPRFVRVKSHVENKLRHVLFLCGSCRGPHRNISMAGPAALITEPQEQVRPALVPAGGHRKSEM